jgi:hypothetical protein
MLAIFLIGRSTSALDWQAQSIEAFLEFIVESFLAASPILQCESARAHEGQCT